MAKKDRNKCFLCGKTMTEKEGVLLCFNGGCEIGKRNIDPVPMVFLDTNNLT